MATFLITSPCVPLDLTAIKQLLQCIHSSRLLAELTLVCTFENVKVPVENTLGEVNNGLKVVLSNFNHERWMMTCIAIQLQRNIVDETLRQA